ncbi:MAG: tRNA (5-methylaminomethyl-2-thiouridine)(34)-methyltransferase MnmD [Bacteroidales bacterium]|nr:tRNA (5-methylaminomethyl-2-thiouridine)(34)-methyltransferase MnmD [Bacteroidales bacterium]MBN2764061.1 tRNA (5-methylaminomethyl-2-thiouridine)(34)-methyltransferase MnmD [Bacteroidales bacterium]
MNKVIITGDGSSTLYVPELNEHFHSVFGAVTESQHVFIQNGLQQLQKDTVAVFEIGFGTGLNALLACLYARRHNRNLVYYTIDNVTLENHIVTSLNYPGFMSTEDSANDIFTSLHNAEWEHMTKITPHFTLYKIKNDMTSYKPNFRYDLIFFDAFAPEKQPEMWTKEIFETLYNPLYPGGLLVTYCAKGKIKRFLKETGFRVEVHPGPPGKRHMVRARKDDKNSPSQNP